MTIKQKFDQFVKDLQANDKIEVVHLKWKPATPVEKNEAGIKFLKKIVLSQFKETLPEDFIYGSEVCNRTHVCWRGEFEGKHYWGEFFLLSVPDMYSPHEPLIESYYADQKPSDLKKLSILDQHSEIGDVHAVYYNRENGILYYNYKYNMYQLNINYKEYLEQVIVHKGAGMWPFLFVDKKHLTDDYTNERIKEWFDNWDRAKAHLFSDSTITISLNEKNESDSIEYENILDRYMYPILKKSSFTADEMIKIMPVIQVEFFAVFNFARTLQETSIVNYFSEHQADNLYNHLLAGLSLLNEATTIEIVKQSKLIMDDESITNKTEALENIAADRESELDGFDLDYKVEEYISKNEDKFKALN